MKLSLAIISAVAALGMSMAPLTVYGTSAGNVPALKSQAATGVTQVRTTRGMRRGGRGTPVGTGFRRGRRGYWRNGRWFWGVPAVGLGLGFHRGCYWNCRSAGFGPGFCRARAGRFC